MCVLGVDLNLLLDDGLCKSYRDEKTRGGGYIYIVKMESPHSHSLSRRASRLVSFLIWMGHTQLDLDF